MNQEAQVAQDQILDPRLEPEASSAEPYFTPNSKTAVKSSQPSAESTNTIVDSDSAAAKPSEEQQDAPQPEEENGEPKNVPEDQWFGDQGFFYGLLKNKKELSEQAVIEVDNKFEQMALEDYAEKNNGQLPSDEEASQVILDFKAARPGEYRDEVEKRVQEVILEKIEEIKGGSLEEAIAAVIDDEEIREQTLQVVRGMMALKEKEGAVDVDVVSGDVGEIGREKTDKEKFKDMLAKVASDVANESDFAAFVAALFGSYSSGLGGSKGRFREGESDIEEMDITKFNENARELARRVGVKAVPGSGEQLKYGFNIMVVKLVKQADSNEGFRDLMSNNSVDLKGGYFEGILDDNLSDEELAKELPKDNILQKRILGLYEMIFTLVKAEQTPQIDALFRETFKEAGLDPSDKLGITEELALYFKVIGGTNQGFETAFE